MGTLMVATMCALPILLLIIRMVVKARQSKVTSLKEIDPAILKVGGTTKKLTACNDEGVDVIVVGSGLGGLTSASLLSKAGYKVRSLARGQAQTTNLPRQRYASAVPLTRSPSRFTR